METLELIEKRLTRIEQQLTNLAPQSEVPERYYTREDIRRIFHISFPTVDEWSDRGILKRYKVANRVFFKVSEVHEALEQR